MITIAQWLSQSPLARNEARLLLQHITGLSHAQLITRDQEPLPETQLGALNQLAQRREQGEPIAYLIGSRAFYGRDFAVSPAVLIPRPETEHLIDAALFRLPEHASVLDLGTGSGIIAITLQCERPDLTVYAGDISQDALDVAQQNAQKFNANVQFAQGSWFEAAHVFRLPENSLDMIVSNPPYIEQHDAHLSQGDLRFEPQNALTDFGDGLNHIRHLIAQSPRWLKPKGWLIMEHGYDQAAQIRALFQVADVWQEIETIQDLAGLDRITLARLI
ncbi:peptide chain release factor N(5)-glutamine methyltransferase [Neisseriaceae bacterium B1]